ncbi:uncharacterized protein G2W53_044508 [Senna tora]|uniref:Uncharacterized protein n=1 Tax=Senna tora TaxID=362788 RepID=A0A834W1N9_9FABA|nr:uncharacterized protein G2W53_044508 [Senna tora]
MEMCVNRDEGESGCLNWTSGKPLTDLTNTDSHTRPFSQSSSSTASVVKSPKPYSSSSFNNPVATKCNSPTSNTSRNRHHASNPSHLPHLLLLRLLAR